MMASDKYNGFESGNPGELISKILRRSTGEKFTRSIVDSRKATKTKMSQKEAWVKEGIMAALYAQHVLGQQLPPMEGPLDGPVGPPPMPPMPPQMGPPPGVDPSMMGGPPPEPMM